MLAKLCQGALQRAGSWTDPLEIIASSRDRNIFFFSAHYSVVLNTGVRLGQPTLDSLGDAVDICYSAHTFVGEPGGTEEHHTMWVSEVQCFGMAPGQRRMGAKGMQGQY